MLIWFKDNKNEHRRVSGSTEFTCPTEVAPCLLDNLLRSGAKIKETCPNLGIGNPNAYKLYTTSFKF